MAIFHLSMKTISRSAGRTATAAAAYRCAQKITHRHTGEVHDYRRKKGVTDSQLFVPQSANPSVSREDLWNAAEDAEKRKNSTVAREIIIALPSELDATARQALAYRLAQELVARHQCAVDVALHEPGKEGDHRNFHAHLLMTTRRLGAEGFNEKTRELDVKTSGEIDYWRARWAQLANEALAQAASSARIDHRSNADREIDAVPSAHMGPGVTAIERDRPGHSYVKRAQEEARAAIAKAIESAKEAATSEQSAPVSDPLDELAVLERDLELALQARARIQADEEAAQHAQAERTSWQQMNATQLAAENTRLLAAASEAERTSRPTDAEGSAAKARQAAHQVLKAAEQEHQALQAEIKEWPQTHKVMNAFGMTGGMDKLQNQADALEKQLYSLRSEARHADSQYDSWRKQRIWDARSPHESKANTVQDLWRTKNAQERAEFDVRNAHLIDAQQRLRPRLTVREASQLVRDAIEAGDERLWALEEEAQQYARDAELESADEEPQIDPDSDRPSEDDDLSPGW